MKDIKELMEYVLKNKYVIICVALVVLLYVLGVIEFITRFMILLILIIAAIYIGKKIQDNEGIIKNIFNMKKDDNVYYYQEKKDKDE